MKNLNIVVSHYNEDINWVNELDYPVFIYSKTIKSEKNIKLQKNNIGNEATSYLEYIVDNYDNLSDWVYFCHGHNESYHQNHPNNFLIKNINLNKIEDGYLNTNNYYNKINKDKTETILTNIQTVDNKPFLIIKDFFEIFLNNFFEMPSFFDSYACAQFFVKKELVRSNDVLFYKKCLEWFYNGESELFDKKWNVGKNIYSSRVFEWLWYFIFTKKNVVKIVKLDNYFNYER